MRKNSESISRYPEYGPLNIRDHKALLDDAETFFNIYWDSPPTYEDNLTNYGFITWLGDGTFGKVALSEHIKTGNKHAIKLIPKEKLIKKENIIKHTVNEKKVMEVINCPFTIYLVSFFMDSTNIYFVMPFVSGGDYFDLLDKKRKLSEDEGRFYMAQVVLALEYLHHLSLIYRDLKPENILFDHTGYLKLADFGFSKRLEKGRTYTLCGTPQYLAPELILNKGYGFTVDWWAFGVLLYESVAGVLPFSDNNTSKMFDTIITLEYTMHPSFSADLSDLIKRLLQSDLSRRLGNLRNGAGDIKDHKWFRPIHWMAILNRRVPPVNTPQPKYSLFDKSEKLKQFPIKSNKVTEFDDKFAELILGTIKT